MPHQKIVTLWEMTGYSEVITLVGAGGKTTTLQYLAKEIRAQGMKVIGTTTTKVYPTGSDFWNSWEHPYSPPALEAKSPCFWYQQESEGKWWGPSIDAVDQALREKVPGSIWVIEGDGAREKSLKCWAQHEPQIPSQSQSAILVISGGLWGRVLSEEEVHRPEKCPELMGKPWTPERAAYYILSSPVFSKKYQKLSWIVLFNQYVELPDIYYVQPNFEHTYLKQLHVEQLYIEETIQAVIRAEENFRKTDQKSIPKHLRFALGDVKKGNLRCYDLW